jgi:putative ABC transport system substrate-binding protein
MRRRDFVLYSAALASAPPLQVAAQQNPPRIGVLSSIAATDPEAKIRVAIFEQALKELRWVSGGNITIDYRWISGGPEALRDAANDLIKTRPQLLVGHATPATRALLGTTSDIPIVFINVVDPIGPRFVESLGRPGGNVTGFTNYEPTMAGKWTQFLTEISPGLKSVGVVFSPRTTPYLPLMWKPLEEVAKSLSVDLVPLPFLEPSDISSGTERFAADGKCGLLVIPDVSTQLRRKQIIDAAASFRLPAVYPYRFFIADGGLISYGVDNADQYRRVASYVDRILRGTPPYLLPVQQPVKFELTINLQTARAQGFTIPPLILATADAVIE